MFFFETLPQELNFEIISTLGPIDLAKCCQVNLASNRDISNMCELWKKHFPEIIFPTNENAKSYIDRVALCYEEKIFEKYSEFVQNLLINQTGSFTCLFQKNEGYYLQTEMSLKTKNQLTNKINSIFQKIGFSSFWNNLIQIKNPSDLNVTYILLKKVNDQNNTEDEAIFLQTIKNSCSYTVSYFKYTNEIITKKQLPTNLSITQFKAERRCFELKNDLFIKDLEKQVKRIKIIGSIVIIGLGILGFSLYRR